MDVPRLTKTGGGGGGGPSDLRGDSLPLAASNRSDTNEVRLLLFCEPDLRKGVASSSKVEAIGVASAERDFWVVARANALGPGTGRSIGRLLKGSTAIGGGRRFFSAMEQVLFSWDALESQSRPVGVGEPCLVYSEGEPTQANSESNSRRAVKRLETNIV